MVTNNRFRILALAACASLALVPAPSTAQAAGSASSASVTAFYNKWNSQPIWFRNGQADPAVAQLIAILKRAPFDGFAAGPQLAAQVEAAAAQASSGQPAAVAAAERVLSSAWVDYVQAVKRPTKGMIYAYPVLQPQGSRADQILLTTAAAPSLSSHLASVSRVNVIYSQLRDAAWAEAQATGNMTPDSRLLANLDRIRSIPATGRFMIVDSGSQRLTMFENGQPVDSMKVIVGTNNMPTPMIASVMFYVTYNPYWNAPDHLARSIARNFLTRGQKYLDASGYQVMSDWTRDAKVIPTDQVDWKAVAAGKAHIRLRQDPGPKNFMGILKFTFPNPEDIFLHDTPTKKLFNEASRDLSNGCVRVEDATRLGRFLLGREPLSPGSQPEIQVQMPQGVPIYLTYVTAQVRDGKLTYLKDIYGWDKAPPTQFASSR